MRFINLLFVLLVNAVPLVGVKYYGWSASTVVVLYWIENLLVACFTCARIALHRVLTRKRGHWRGGQVGVQVNGKPLQTGLLGEYATLAFVFTLAHGIFVFGFTAIAADHHPGDALWTVSRAQLLQGVQWMFVAMATEFLVDAATLRRRSFAWLKAYVGARTGRVLVLHLALIVGMWGMMVMESPFAVLYVLIALKTLWDLFASNASARAADLPDEPPAWALKLGAQQHGRSIAQQRAWWKQEVEARKRAEIEDEQVMPAT